MRALEEIRQDVLRNPARDDFRLEFADACGDPELAAFIRGSLRRDEIGYYNPRASTALEDRLLAPFRALGAGGNLRRGFVEHLVVDPELFIRRGSELIELGPITKVSFQTKGPKRELPMNELVASHALLRIPEIHFNVREQFDLNSLRAIIEATQLDKLLVLGTPWESAPGFTLSEAQESDLWSELLESRQFRQSIRWGLGPMRRTCGDRFVVVPGRDDNYDWEDVTYVPMPAEDRLIEEQYGYIPQLHAVNWDKTVLDALRGKFPAFPVGSSPTKEMYAVPAPHRRNEQFHRENW